MNRMADVFGIQNNPYYIWAPRWIESSAGVRAVHFLCHSLNRAGQSAYVVPAEPPLRGEPRVNPTLQTPILSQEVIDSHTRAGRVPIAIYPEDVLGNPLNTSMVVRFLWNYSSALGGPEVFDSDEIIWAFSLNIALDYFEKTGTRAEVLFVPPVDPREFAPQEEKKGFQVVYAGKYRSFVGKPPLVGDLPTVEIFRDGIRKQPREVVRRLLRDANVVYSFENSSIVTEAILSGTPAGFIPNKFLGNIIAEQELGWSGTFIGQDSKDIDAARNSLKEGIAAYQTMVDKFPDALDSFIGSTQFRASTLGFDGEVNLPSFSSHATPNRIKLGLLILRQKGVKVFAREVCRFVLRALRR
jgi:hypothetical protein